MRRTITVGVVALATSTVLVLSPSAPALSQVASGDTGSTSAKVAARKPVPTKFAYSAAGFGSRLAGGSVPGASDETAFDVIGCTNNAGIVNRNYEADARLPGLGNAEGVTTSLRTEKVGPNEFATVAQHSIAKLVLANSGLGSVEIRGIEAYGRAFNKNGKYGVTDDVNVAKIVFQPAAGPAQTLAIPTPKRPLVIPGLVRIDLGRAKQTVNGQGAEILSSALQIKLLPAGTKFQVAQANARISGGITRGIFRGYSAGLQARGLEDNVESGKTPHSVMPCQGTDNQLETRGTAKADLGGQVVANGLTNGQIGHQTKAMATGKERARIAHVSLGDGQLEINGIVGQVEVTRIGGKIKANTLGTTFGEIVANGETYSMPKFGPLEIPGIAKIEDAVTEKIPNGIKVVALRITLLDGSGAVVDLGTAQLAINGSGLPNVGTKGGAAA